MDICISDLKKCNKVSLLDVHLLMQKYFLELFFFGALGLSCLKGIQNGAGFHQIFQAFS